MMVRKRLKILLVTLAQIGDLYFFIASGVARGLSKKYTNPYPQRRAAYQVFPGGLRPPDTPLQRAPL